jgi:uncharacterized protein (TIGR00251 family)
VAVAQIRVRVQPGASRERVAGLRDGTLVVHVAAPALEGRANRALCRLLAKHLGVAPSKLTIVRGERAREKLVAVEGVEQAVDAALKLG